MNAISKAVYMVSATFIASSVIVMTAGCSDAEKAIRSSGAIKCYSAGTVIYEGASNGRIRYEAPGTWLFKDAKTGKYIRVSGECLIEN